MGLLTLTQGNTRPPVKFTLKDVNGVAIDITGCTLTFKMIMIGNNVPAVSAGSATIDIAASGTCHYNWAAHDLDAPGSYHGTLTVVWPDTTSQTTNIMGFEINPAIATIS